MHTDKDPVVIVENESVWAGVVPAVNLTTAVAVEAVPTHCGFTAAEAVAGWEMLRGWVSGGPQPSAASIHEACVLISANPATPGPCRIDPSYVVKNMDWRIRPR